MNVSVIIPAFNAAETIDETLESLLAQTYPNWEALVIDDGSNDITAEVAAKFAEQDPRIRMISQQRGGESAARNTGIALARYDWLLFLDADDWILPNQMKRLTDTLLADQELDAVLCGSARYAPDGTLIVEEFLPNTDDLFATLARRPAFPIHTCIVRKTLVETVGKFDTSLCTSADWDLWQRIARTGARFSVVYEVLSIYRMRPNSASLNAFQMLNDGLRVIKQGHSPDPRVPNPHPDHQKGLSPELIPNQIFYFASWCAGLVLGCGKDARILLEILKGMRNSQLDPQGIAKNIFEAIPLSKCQPHAAWVEIWPSLEKNIEEFLVALEQHTLTPGLAHRSRAALESMILKYSMVQPIQTEGEKQNHFKHNTFKELLKQGNALLEKDQIIQTYKTDIERLEKLKKQLEAERSDWQKLAENHQQSMQKQKTYFEELEKAKTRLEAERSNWQKLSENNQQSIQQQKTYIEELEKAKAQLEVERSDWQKLAENQQQSIQKQKTYIEELEKAKAQLEVERTNWQKLAENNQQSMQKQKTYIEELAKAKAQLEEERSNWQKLAENQQQTIQKQKNNIEELTKAKAQLEVERSDWQKLAEQRESIMTELQRKLWIRLGLRLRVLQCPMVGAHDKEQEKNIG